MSMNNEVNLAREILQRGWLTSANATSATINTLPSYIDKNFHIKTETAEFVLKVAHPQTSTEALTMENRAMQRLALHDSLWKFPAPLPNKIDGSTIYVHSDGALTPCRARLVNFIPGTVYQKLAHKTAALLSSLGACVGHMTRTLSAPPTDNVVTEHDWDIKRAFKYIRYAQHITDSTLQANILRYGEQWNSTIPRLDNELAQGVIHNDANDLNVIVQEDASQVSAVIDFGDLCYTYLIADLAVACTYALPYHDNPLHALQHIVNGYRTQRSVTEHEANIFHALIIARLCQSILMATKASTDNPSNAHSQVSQTQVRGFLAVWESINANDVRDILMTGHNQ